MIFGTIEYIYERRSAKCLRCSAPVNIFQVNACPKCNYCFEGQELKIMRGKADRDFRVASVKAFLPIVILLATLAVVAQTLLH